MAETKTTASEPSSALGTSEPAALEKSQASKAEGSMAFTGGPPLGFRALVGFSGLSLLVGFFLPWFRAEAEGEHDSGLTMMLGEPVGGTPAMLLIAVPVLGVILSALAFMGFRWTAHAAIGVAALLLGYGLWILLSLFVEHTALGLWVVVGGAFVTLLLGLVTLLWNRDKKPLKATSAPVSDQKK